MGAQLQTTVTGLINVDQDSLVAIDTETTGLNPRTDRLVQFAMSHRYRKHSQVINPQRPVGFYASVINGLRDSDVRGAPTFLEVAPFVVSAICCTSVVAMYNAPFDCRMINAEFARVGLNFRVDPDKVIDPLFWARRAWPNMTHRLEDICEHLGVPRSTHKADDDAESLRLVTLKMIGLGVMPSRLADVLSAQNYKKRNPWTD